MLFLHFSLQHYQVSHYYCCWHQQALMPTVTILQLESHVVMVLNLFKKPLLQ
jgi:hypothetical protein